MKHASPNRDRLLWAADHIEELARQVHDDRDRSRLHTISAEARMNARNPILGHAGLQLAMEAALSQARFMAWQAGLALPAPSNAHTRTTDTPTPIPQPIASPAPPVPPSALNARQLAERFAISERGARKAIETAISNGRHGFYREGKRLFADPAVFGMRRRRLQAQ